MSVSSISSTESFDNQIESQTSRPLERGRKPLIEYCTNEWAHNEKYKQARSSSPEADTLDDLADVLERIWEVVKGPKFRRAFLALVLVIGGVCTLWITMLGEIVEQETAVWESIDTEEVWEGGVWGKNKKVYFPEVTQIKDLDPGLLPSDSDSLSKKRRLIFIGDVHGCMDELSALLKKVKYNAKKDHIIVTGDMINKGPKSKEVIEYLRQEQASCVRGNHEDRILLTAQRLTSTILRTNSNVHDRPESASESKELSKHARDIELATSLSKKDLSYLRACPLILRVGETKTHGEIVVAHAGIVPEVPLQDQDPFTLMNMRVMNIKTHVPSKDSERKGCVPWAEIWNSYQRIKHAKETLSWNKKTGKPPFKHTTVVYGHDSKLDLQMRRWSKGLDSGCVNGGKLTAWVLGNGGKEKTVQVQCKNYRQQASESDGKDTLQHANTKPAQNEKR